MKVNKFDSNQKEPYIHIYSTSTAVLLRKEEFREKQTYAQRFSTASRSNDK